MSTFSKEEIFNFSEKLNNAIETLVDSKSSKDKVNLTLQEFSHPENIVKTKADGTPLDETILNDVVDN